MEQQTFYVVVNSAGEYLTIIDNYGEFDGVEWGNSELYPEVIYTEQMIEYLRKLYPDLLGGTVKRVTIIEEED